MVHLAPCHAKDVLFMTFDILRNSGQWTWLSRMFCMKAPTFDKLIKTLTDMLFDYSFETYVKIWGTKCTMHKLVQHGRTFEHFTHVRYATDLNFQISY